MEKIVITDEMRWDAARAVCRARHSCKNICPPCQETANSVLDVIFPEPATITPGPIEYRPPGYRHQRATDNPKETQAGKVDIRIYKDGYDFYKREIDPSFYSRVHSRKSDQRPVFKGYWHGRFNAGGVRNETLRQHQRKSDTNPCNVDTPSVGGNGNPMHSRKGDSCIRGTTTHRRKDDPR